MNGFDGKIDRLRELLSGAPRNIAIVSHTNPDGDAVGSSIALARVLRGLGHRTGCLVPNRYPYFLEWMEGIADVVVYKENGDAAEKIVSEADLIFCMDFNRIDRLEALSEAITANETAKRILIDHHLDPPKDFDLDFSDPGSCSTSYVTYRIIENIAGLNAIDKAAAEGLYVGIMTDTGNFSFSSLTPDLFRAVAVLVDRGVNVPEVNAAVYNSYVEGRVRLLGYVLMNKMKLIHDGTAAYISLKENELRRFDFQVGDSEGFVNYPLTIIGVKMSAMFLQTRRFIRISLRSRGGVDVSEFAAKYFDGGGHKNAAGGKSFESMEKTVKKYEKAVEEFLREEKDR